jgi:asparagine synthase (glutamine-hydrolysing)
MSGIVAIVNLDGAPADRELLDRMTRSMAQRGPDAQGVWTEANVGFGHALLRTSVESDRERQPWRLGDNVWITADARVDARADLLRELAHHGRTNLGHCSDVELILHAYHVWDEACVDHLLGDFAFVIWNTQRRRLFCARDHFGVKPLFYAHVKSQLIISNTLDSIRLHPAVSDCLNDAAIADFLVSGYIQDPRVTSFADIRRLPPAHVLTYSKDGVRVRRYWTLPVDGPIRYRRQREYVEHFKDVLGAAVADRLRTAQAGIFMSGGVDSTSVAAAAIGGAKGYGRECQIHAFTVVYDQLIPDQEREYATIAATALDIPIRFLSADTYSPYEHWDDTSCRTPEPFHEPLANISRDLYRDASAHARVVLSGEGGDALFRYQTDVVGLLKTGKIWRVGSDVAQSIFARRLPPVAVRTTLKKLLRAPTRRYSIPSWIESALADRLCLVERFSQLESRRIETRHPIRGDAERLLLNPKWASSFELQDPAATRLPLEFRYPFFDLRVIRYVLAIPPVPWSQDKELLRTPLSAVLPEVIRRRPKAPLAGDPLVEHLRHPAMPQRIQSLVAKAPSTYIRHDVLQRALEGAAGDLWTNLRPVSLAYWLRWSNVSLS